MQKNRLEPENNPGELLVEAMDEYHSIVGSGVLIDEQFFRKYASVEADLREYIAADRAIDAEIEIVAEADMPTVIGARAKTVTIGDLRIPGHEVEEEAIGFGGMGVVFKAKQLSMNRTVAIKVSLDIGRPESIGRLLNEVETVGSLQHSHIVEVFSRGTCEGRPYFTMEYMEGGNLEQMISKKPMTIHEAADLIQILAVAVQYCHDKDIVHRDLKPSNILFTDSVVPKIGDFGLSKAFGPDEEARRYLTLSFQVIGTPEYMSPEQAWGRRDGIESSKKSDIYSLGAILYELLAGQPPFSESSPEQTLEKVRHGSITKPSSLVKKRLGDLEWICLKCLTKDPEKRYESANQLADDLTSWKAGRPTIAGNSRKSRLRTRTFLASAAVIIGVIVTLFAVSILQPTMLRRQINRQLAQGEEVKLLGTTGQPRLHKIIFKDEPGKVEFFDDSPCRFSCKDAAFLVLLDQFDKDRYWFSVEICHDESYGRDAGVGLFIAQEPFDSVKGPSGCLLRFNDIENLAEDRELTTLVDEAFKSMGMEMLRPPTPTHNHLKLYGYTMMADAKNRNRSFPFKPNKRWRKLEIEVRPDVIYVHWDGKKNAIKLTMDDVRTVRENRQPSRSSLGLYVRSSVASFQNVKVKLLPNLVRNLKY